jgi:hypothetical protein
LLVILAFIIYIILAAVFFNGLMSKHPYDLFGISGPRTK